MIGMRRYDMSRRLAAPVLALLVWGCASAVPRDATPVQEWRALSEQAEIRRTDYGVPHIRADNLRAAGFALGWVQLEDHGVRIVHGLVEARGESARYPGPDGGSVDSDLLARRSHARALETFPLLPPDVQDVYEGFAIAVNRYVELHPDEFPGLALPLFTGADVSARDVGQPAWAVARRFASRAEAGRPILHSGAGDTGEESRLAGWEPGSNVWAFGPARTRSGRAILMRNPHLSWAAGYYEAQITVPGVLNFYGDFRLGGPFGMIGGWNERLGWSSTNNAPQLNDIYALGRDPARPDHYLFEGEPVPIERVPVSIQRLTDAGVAAEDRELLETAIGPVVHQDDERIYVMRSGADGAYRVGEQFLRMMTARSLDEWRDAMRIQARESSNFTYADADGNIFYVWNAAHPVRPHPMAETAWRSPAGAADVWTGIIPFDDLPQLLNPPGGYLRNENDPFHYTNLNAVLDPADYPARVPAAPAPPPEPAFPGAGPRRPAVLAGGGLGRA
jgi:acyl-homoserine-lactone acylase